MCTLGFISLVAASGYHRTKPKEVRGPKPPYSETEKEAQIRDFPEVTEIPEAQIPVKGVEHVIETTKDPPFGPIYNLSETELAFLREYLNKGLDRG